MKIIDAHTHIYPDQIVEKAVESIGNFYSLHMYSNGKISKLLELADKYDVSKIVVCSVATSAKQVKSINDYMASQLSIDKFFPLATLHPNMTKEEIEIEVKRINDLNLKGIKLHPDFQKFSINSDSAYKVFEAIGDYKHPILVHTGDKRFDYSHPSYMAQAARDFPHLTFVAAHMGGWSEWDDVMLYKNLNNVYFDTSSSLSFLDKEKAKNVILELGPDKIMFGTDFPMWNYDIEVPLLYNLGFSNEINEMIFYKNAQRIYGILD